MCACDCFSFAIVILLDTFCERFTIERRGQNLFLSSPLTNLLNIITMVGKYYMGQLIVIIRYETHATRYPPRGIVYYQA